MKIGDILTDGSRKIFEIHKTELYTNIDDSSIRNVHFALLSAKDSRTLRRSEFLAKAWNVLNVANQKWYFIRNPKKNPEI